MSQTQEQVISAISRRQQAADAQKGEVIGVEYIDRQTKADDLSVDSTRLTAQSQQEIDSVTTEKVAVLTEVTSSDTVFVTLFEMPNEHSWGDSQIKDFLYSRGITADTLDDVLGVRLTIDPTQADWGITPTDETETDEGSSFNQWVMRIPPLGLAIIFGAVIGVLYSALGSFFLTLPVAIPLLALLSLYTLSLERHMKYRGGGK